MERYRARSGIACDGTLHPADGKRMFRQLSSLAPDSEYGEVYLDLNTMLLEEEPD